MQQRTLKKSVETDKQEVNLVTDEYTSCSDGAAKALSEAPPISSSDAPPIPPDEEECCNSG